MWLPRTYPTSSHGVRVKYHARLDLLDYRQHVSELYRRVRTSDAIHVQVCQQFRAHKDELFRHHSQSPLDAEQRRAFAGLAYYPCDPAFRVSVPVDTNVDPGTFDFDLGVIRVG